jgi:pimeloyl-ACP methyl ester carboxylesterase
METISMKEIQVNGIRLSYRDSNSGAAGEAGGRKLPTLFFVHGAGGALEQYASQHGYFASAYRVVSVSLRGHGDSGEPAEPGKDAYALPLMASDLEGLIDTLGLGPVHYVGNSAGGVLGFELAARRPELVASLATFGTVARMAFPTFLRNFTYWYDQKTVSGDVHRKLQKVASYVSKKKDVQAVAAAMFIKAARSIPYFRYALGSYNYLDTVKTLHCPYAIIRGSLDSDINLMIGSTLRALRLQAASTNVPSCVLDLPGAGHLANLDDPGGFNSLLAGWLDTVRWTSGLTDFKP